MITDVIRKPNKDLPSQNVYPREVEYVYERLAEKLTDVQLEYLEELVENIYKVAYTDGVKDMLYFNNVE